MNLQKAALGLLGAFGLKVTGQNPPVFGDAVVPVADVYDQYLATSELQVQNAVLTTALSGFNSKTFTVPVGKVWRLKAASLIGGLNAADTALISMSTVNIQSPNSAPNGCRIAMATQQNTAGPRCVAYTGPTLFLPSGWSVVLELWTNTAITVSTNCQATIFLQEFDL